MGRGHSGFRRRGIGEAEVLRIVAEEVLGDQVAAGHAVALGFDNGIGDVGPDGERRVGGQRPGRGGPGEGLHACQFAGQRRVTGEDGEGDGDGLVLAVLVDVLVHAEFMVGKRGLVVPAVREHAVAVVGQALLVQRLEGPQHRFHVFGIERLVVVLEVHPPGLAGDVVLPLPRVLHHGGPGGVIELVDAHREDLLLVRHAELLHGLEFGGQPVGIPAETALHAAAALRLVAAHEVLRVSGQEVAVVRQAVREGRPVVEHELVRAVGTCVACIDGGLEGAVLVPVSEDPLFDGGELRRGGCWSGCAGGRRLGVARDCFGVDLRHVVILWWRRVGARDGNPAARTGTALGYRLPCRLPGTGPAVPPHLPPSSVPLPSRKRSLRGCHSFFGCDGLPVRFYLVDGPLRAGVPLFRKLTGDGRVDADVPSLAFRRNACRKVLPSAAGSSRGVPQCPVRQRSQTTP